MRQIQQNSGQPVDPRELAKWARIYAQSRTLGVVVFMLIFLGLSAAIGVPAYLSGLAHRQGHTLLAFLCLVATVPGIVATIYFSVPRWGGKRMEQWTARLYASEGNAAVTIPHSQGRRRVMMVIVPAFLACIFASVVLGFLGYIPDEYRQPVSALYVVPFLVALLLLQRPMVGWGAMLWPAMYALHAILIVAGAPILFHGPWDYLNMLIPTAGYGLLTALIGHAWSRLALRKIRTLAACDSAGQSAREASRDE